jgi:hypothetical protein
MTMRYPLLMLVFMMSFSSYSQTPLNGQIYDGVWLDFTNQDNLEYLLIDSTNTDNIWHIGIPYKNMFIESPSLFTETNLYYGPNIHSWFQIKMNDYQNGGPTYMYLNAILDTEEGKDGMYVEVSYDGGMSFVNIVHDTLPGYLQGSYTPWLSQVLYSETDTLYNGEPGFSGSQNLYTEITWQDYCVHPESQNSQHTQLQDSMIVRFNFISDSISTQHEGVQINDFYMEVVLCFGLDENGTNAFLLRKNPTSDYIQLENIDHLYAKLDYEVLDLQGKQMMNGHFFSAELNQIDISTLEKGMYLLYIKSQDQGLVSNHRILKE